MSIQQTATVPDEQVYREDSIGTLLVEQFKNNHFNGRNRRFVDIPETSDPSESEVVELPANREETFVETPLLWHETEEQKGIGIALQKWEGVVLRVSKESFYARLYDLTASNPEEEAEFSMEDVAEDDHELVQPGAVFYWSIGYYTNRTGQKYRYSIVKFRRLPAWGTGEIKIIEDKALELGKAIGWGSKEDTSCAR